MTTERRTPPLPLPAVPESPYPGGVPQPPPVAPPPGTPEPKKPLRKRVIASAGTGLAGAAYIIWMLLTGQSGAKDFHGQDLRDQGNRFASDDMIESNFSEANVSGIDMTGINMHESDLRRIIAEGTNFADAHFPDADGRDANFRNARLVEADFTRADLRNADFRGADLRGVNFTQANLEGADLRNAIFGEMCGLQRMSTQAHCDPQQPCCDMVWNQAEVTNLRGCIDPMMSIFQNVSEVGEPQLTSVERVEGDRRICSEQPPTPPYP